MKMNENLAAVHAYLCADGYVIKNPLIQKQKYYVIGFRNTNLTLLKDFQNNFYNVFKIKPHLIEGQRCRIGSKKIYELLTQQFGSFYSWEWKMPKINEKLKRVWLRAYFDCEGWVTCKSHKNRMIGADCVNLRGIKQIQDALNDFGISTKLKKRNNRNIFSLSIFGKENLIKFYNKIGFLHPLKIQKLNMALQDFVVYEWNYPQNDIKLKRFIISLLSSKARIRKDRRAIRIITNKELNLQKLKRGLDNIFKIHSNLNRRVNGIGTVYYELSINRMEDIKKLINKYRIKI